MKYTHNPNFNFLLCDFYGLELFSLRRPPPGREGEEQSEGGQERERQVRDSTV